MTKNKIALELLNYGIIKYHTQTNSTHSDRHCTLLAQMLQLGFLIYIRDHWGTYFFHIKVMLSVCKVEIPFLAKKTQNKLPTTKFHAALNSKLSLIYQWFQIDIILYIYIRNMLSYSFLINDFNQMQCRKKIKSNPI